MNGIMNTVRKRSRFESSVRVAIMAGTEQPNPTSIGTKDFPGRPIQRMKRSMTNAARDIYPESSRMERQRNMKATGGRKVPTVWMADPKPLAIMATTQFGALIFSSRNALPSTKIVPPAISKKSMKALPTD